MLDNHPAKIGDSIYRSKPLGNISICLMQKTELRKLYKEKRKELSQSDFEERCRAIVEGILTHFDFSSVEYLHLFLPIHRQREIDTYKLIDQLKNRYPLLKIVVPKVIPNSFEMTHYLYTPTTLELNSWGIPEPLPIRQNQIAESQIQVVIVPLLIFDTQGNRVGYGKGFYDRFLQKCTNNPLKIGVCIENAVEKIDNIDPFDIRLDFCVSPNTLYDFR